MGICACFRDWWSGPSARPAVSPVIENRAQPDIANTILEQSTLLHEIANQPTVRLAIYYDQLVGDLPSLCNKFRTPFSQQSKSFICVFSNAPPTPHSRNHVFLHVSEA